MARKAARPKVVKVGPARASAVRGPHADGSGRWYWQGVAYDPVAQARTTVWSGWALRRDVEVALAQLVATGADLTEQPAHTTVTTVRDLMECWLWHVQNVGGRRGPLRPSSVRVYSYAARHLSEVLGEVRVDRLNRATVESHRDTRIARGAASATVKSELRALGHAYRWWGDRSPRPLPPFPSVGVTAAGVRDRYTPTRSEVLAVVDALDGWARVCTVLLYATGARPAEIRDLRWRAVDLARGEVTLDGKTGRRTVPLADDPVRVLAAWRRETSPESDATVLGLTVSSFNSYFGPRRLRAACAAAGVPRFTPYGLRRAAVDAMARAGVDIATAASITGHSPVVMLRHYRTVSADDRRRAVAVAGLGSLEAPKVVPFRRHEEG